MEWILISKIFLVVYPRDQFWAHCLSLNISKTKFVLFYAPNKPKYPIIILTNNKAIDEGKFIRYLGVTLDAQLSFRYHIDEAPTFCYN